MSLTLGSLLARDRRGAVFVEKLIVYLPLLLAFFGAWELAEFTAASLVVQRASAAAGRAAVVVLPDDPAFYDDEPVDSFGGLRQADIELAAGMILSSNPHMREDFSVDIPDVPSGGAGGKLEVTVTAAYDCGMVSLVCGADSEIELTSTTVHTYQGAKYAYGMPVLGGGGGALVGNFNSGERSDDAEASFRAKGKGKGGCEPPCPPLASQNWPAPVPNKPPPGVSTFKCPAFTDFQLQNKTKGLPMVSDTSTGKKLGDAYGKKGLSQKAFNHRCKLQLDPNKNVAVVRWECSKNGRTVTRETIDISTGSDPNNWQHSEQNALIKYEDEATAMGFDVTTDCRPMELYTERDCCYHPTDASCNDFFANGNQGITKNPNIKTSAEELKALGNKVTWHLDYNNGYKYFDERRCGTKDYSGAAAKALCKELEDGLDACKKVNIKAKKCDQAVPGINTSDFWAPTKAQQQKDMAQYDKDLAEWEKRRDAYKKAAAGNKPCNPGAKPKEPPWAKKKNQVEPTPQNQALVKKCLDAMALKEAFDNPINKTATEALKEEMTFCPP
jgi:hypothetical protein